MRISKFRPFEDPDSSCSDPNLAAPLVFDLFGPLVVQFQRATKKHPSRAIICAPLCPDHHANILTDNDDISLNGWPTPAPKQGYKKGYIYYFKSANAPNGAAAFDPPSSKSILRVQYDRPHKTQKPRSCRITPKEIAKKCHLVMVVPMPNRIAELRPESIWIHRNDADKDLWVIDKDVTVKKYLGQAAPDDIVNSSRGRGLRLIYNNCQHPPTLSSQEPDMENKTSFDGLCALTRGFPVPSEEATYIPPYYSMTLRFAAAHASTYEALDDAYSCFQSMRALFDAPKQPSAFSQWRVDFGHSLEVTKEQMEIIGGMHPHDCGAAVLAMQDWQDSASSKTKVKR